MAGCYREVQISTGSYVCLLLYVGDVFCRQRLPLLQFGGALAAKDETVCRELQQYQATQVADVMTSKQLLKPAASNAEISLCLHHHHSRTKALCTWICTIVISRELTSHIAYVNEPTWFEFRSMVLSNSVLMKSRLPLSPNAPLSRSISTYRYTQVNNHLQVHAGQSPPTGARRSFTTYRCPQAEPLVSHCS